MIHEDMYIIGLEKIVKQFKINLSPNQRYASFDYCYNYFLNTENPLEDIEKSCLVLAFYLASWGMLRGSSFLLNKSIKHYQATIQLIASIDKSAWNIDVINYDTKNIQEILHIYREVKKCIISGSNADLTLVTKILLGVFGFIPAFDTYFCATFKKMYRKRCAFRKLNADSLEYIREFYESNKLAIDKLALETFTIDFVSGLETTTNYPRAKIIDMYGFTARSL
ncbi:MULTISPECIES: hypothetical protein [Hymenobacter]|uniref:hypothetical protein n=1 Tax=Hymenobacter TaxID=89966 RepID=UPI001FD3F7BC|nr:MULTISPECIES: hypothetical protein [Hymenobacter]UOQ80344.1 hypothetical protein MUN83_16155 [Hymenobacter sp. 5414T-23]